MGVDLPCYFAPVHRLVDIVRPFEEFSEILSRGIWSEFRENIVEAECIVIRTLLLGD